MYGLLNADKSIWIEGEGRSGGGVVGGGGEHERSRYEKGVRGGWVRRQTQFTLLLRESIIY